MFTLPAFLALPWKKIAIYAGAGILLLFIVFGVRSCFKKTPKLNEKQIQEAKVAIAETDRKVMEKVLVESDANEAEINAAAVNATTVKVNTIVESKEKWANATTDEMAAELERRAKQ